MNAQHDEFAVCIITGTTPARKSLKNMASALGTVSAMVSMCVIRASPAKEIPVNQTTHQNDKKDSQNTSSKDPSANPSQTNQKPGDRNEDQKTGGDKTGTDKTGTDKR